MTLTSTIDKTRHDIEHTISDPTPLYAVVGVGDLTVATLRTARAQLRARAAELDPTALPGKAQTMLGDAVSTAVSTYVELAGRGRSLVTRVRRQEATADLGQQAKVTVAKAKAASTTTKKAVTETKTAVKSARTTTRKSAAKTTTAAKSATTSAKKAIAGGRKTAESAAAKVGDRGTG